MNTLLAFFIGILVGFALLILLIIIIFLPGVDLSKSITLEVEEINEETKEDETEEE